MIQRIICLSAILTISSCTLNNENDIRVLSINRVVDKTDTASKVCENFNLTENEIISFFQVAEQVSNEEDHGASVISPCKYEGKIIMEYKTYSYEVFAGGTGYIYDKNGWAIKNFICRSNDCCTKFSELC